MNRIHHWLCRSAHWQKVVEQRGPWVISSANLGQDVLETGPGPGFTTDFLRSRVLRLTAIEADPGLAESLRSRMSGANVSVVTGDVTAMPFPDATFSGCASFTMLHHMPSRDLQDKMLREVRRVLQPGGVFVGSDSLQSAFMRIIHIGDTCVLVNPDTFAARLEAAGFEVFELEKSREAFRFHARKPISFQISVP